MKKIKDGDIVVSMILQATASGNCPIPMGYVSQALVDNGCANVLWFQETTSGEGAYHAENFRLATEKERQDYFKKGPYTIEFSHSLYLPGTRVKSITDLSIGTGTIVAINIERTCYLIKLDVATSYYHNGHDHLYIGSNRNLKSDGFWLYMHEVRKIDDQPPLSTTSVYPTAVVSCNVKTLTTNGISRIFPSNTIPLTGTIASFPDIISEKVPGVSIEIECVKQQEAVIIQRKSTKRQLLKL